VNSEKLFECGCQPKIENTKLLFLGSNFDPICHHGYSEEAWKGSLGQVVQIGKREGISSQSCVQIDPAEQEVWILGEEQSLVGSLCCAWSMSIFLYTRYNC
jgi:hypothetical protein